MHPILKLLSIAALAVTFSACSKSYTCSCKVDYFDANGQFTHTGVNTASMSGRKSVAEDDCANSEAEHNASLYRQADCTLLENS